MPKKVDLQETEERHGFRFGSAGDDGQHALVLKTLTCPTKGCDRARGPGIPVHEDTVTPIVCGGCGAVLHCDHKPGEWVDTIMGTLGAPRLRTARYCMRCHTLLDAEERDVPPVRIEDLPASSLAALGIVAPRL